MSEKGGLSLFFFLEAIIGRACRGLQVHSSWSPRLRRSTWANLGVYRYRADRSGVHAPVWIARRSGGDADSYDAAIALKDQCNPLDHAFQPGDHRHDGRQS